jgi:hypothetical protein
VIELKCHVSKQHTSEGVSQLHSFTLVSLRIHFKVNLNAHRCSHFETLCSMENHKLRKLTRKLSCVSES